MKKLLLALICACTLISTAGAVVFNCQDLNSKLDSIKTQIQDREMSDVVSHQTEKELASLRKQEAALQLIIEENCHPMLPIHEAGK